MNGRQCSTFKEAAHKRGLLESDQSIFECLNEAMSFQMPRELRRLFATILVYRAPNDVRTLWDTYFEAISEDFIKEPRTIKELQLTQTLRSFNFFLESMGKNMHNTDMGVNLLRDIQDEMSIEKIPCEDLETEKRLNQEQHTAFQIILKCIKKGKGGMFFIDGPRGNGKTFLYRALLAHLRSRKIIAIATATCYSCNNAWWKNSSFTF